MEKGWELDFPAALSSTQQCSICNQFQGFLTFCRVRDEKGENEAKKKCKIHQKIGKTMISGQNNGKTHTKQIQKGWEFDFPAALSSTQQCSICNQFQGFLTFCRVRGEKAENEAKKTQNPSKNWRNNELWTKQKKNTDKKREKGWELDFPAALSSTQQCSICNQFQGFLTFCRVRVEKVRTKPKKSTKSIKQIGETMNSGQNKRKTQTKKGKKAGNWISSAALSSQPISRFPDFLQGQG